MGFESWKLVWKRFEKFWTSLRKSCEVFVQLGCKSSRVFRSSGTSSFLGETIIFFVPKSSLLDPVHPQNSNFPVPFPFTLICEITWKLISDHWSQQDHYYRKTDLESDKHWKVFGSYVYILTAASFFKAEIREKGAHLWYVCRLRKLIRQLLRIQNMQPK